MNENLCADSIGSLIDDLLESWAGFRGQARRPSFIARLKQAGVWIVGRQWKNKRLFPLIRLRLAEFLGITPDEARRVLECLQKIEFITGDKPRRRGTYTPTQRQKLQISNTNLSHYAAKQFRFTNKVLTALGLADSVIVSSIPENLLNPSDYLTAQDVIKNVRTDYVVSSSVLGTYRDEAEPEIEGREHERVRRELQAKTDAKTAAYQATIPVVVPPDVNGFWAKLGMLPPNPGEDPDDHKRRCREHAERQKQAAFDEAVRVEEERKAKLAVEAERVAKIEARRAKRLKVPGTDWFKHKFEQNRDPNAWREAANKPIVRPRRIQPEDDGSYDDGALRPRD